MSNSNAFDRSKTLESRRTFLRSAGAVTALSAMGPISALAQGSSSPKPAVLTPRPAIDFRSYNNKNYVTEVRDQGSCNSCTAFAVVAAIETAKSLKDNTPNPRIHLSEDQLFSCAGPGCDTNAWYPDEALKYCKTTGLTGFDTYAGNCNAISTPQKISDWKPLNDASAMKDWMSGNNPNGTPSPVISVFVLYQDLVDYTANNLTQIYSHKVTKRRDEARLGGHVVCIVGYDDSQRYWICKNSWTEDWGGAGLGFFKIGYGECHIDDYRMYGVVL